MNDWVLKTPLGFCTFGCNFFWLMVTLTDVVLKNERKLSNNFSTKKEIKKLWYLFTSKVFCQLWFHKISQSSLPFDSFPSHATIFTLSTLMLSPTSLNVTLFNTNVHTLSQNLYVFNRPLKLILFFTFEAREWLMALSNCSNTCSASCGVICCDWINSSRLSCKLFPNVVFLYNW